MADWQHYIKASERVLVKAQTRREQIDVKCSECRWLGRADHSGDHECDNPIVILASTNEADHIDRKYIRRISEQRDGSSLFGAVVCGPMGTLFEPMPERPSFWQRLFGRR